MAHPSRPLYEQQLLKALQRNATYYKNVAPIVEETGLRLLSRLAYFRFPPQTILDLGCGQGFDTQLLAQAYPSAEIIAADFCQTQLQHWNGPTPEKNIQRCVAHANQLPFPRYYFDLLFANLLLPTITDYPTFWQECLRVLKPGGILLVTTLGPETLKELRQSLAQWQQEDCVNIFPTADEIASSLALEGFLDTAIERETIEFHYAHLSKLLIELKRLGSVKIWKDYPHLYKTRLFWQSLENYYREHFSSKNQKLIASAEIFYTIAFAPTQSTESLSSISIPIAQIKRKTQV